MTSQDELRDRIAEFIDAALVAWNTDMDTQGSEGEYAAQAIIDEFGLTLELKAERNMTAADPFEFDHTQRIVGKWEPRE